MGGMRAAGMTLYFLLWMQWTLDCAAIVRQPWLARSRWNWRWCLSKRVECEAWLIPLPKGAPSSALFGPGTSPGGYETQGRPPKHSAAAAHRWSGAPRAYQAYISGHLLSSLSYDRDLLDRHLCYGPSSGYNELVLMLISLPQGSANSGGGLQIDDMRACLAV